LGAGGVIYLLESVQDNSHFFSYSILYMGVIGVGAIALFYILGKSVKSATPIAVIAALITLPVPILMGADGWDDHDRSDRYTARDFAANYLYSATLLQTTSTLRMKMQFYLPMVTTIRSRFGTPRKSREFVRM